MARKFRWMALKIAILITVIFAIQVFIPKVTDDYLLKSSDVYERPWILVTSIFLHGSFVHYAYNMFALVLFGLILEKRVGTLIFLLVFFAGGIFANIVTVPFYEASLGASGAIYAIIAMLAVVWPWLPVWAAGLPMPMWLAAIVWTAGNFIILLAPTNIGAIAHLSGALFGFLAGMSWKAAKKKV